MVKKSDRKQEQTNEISIVLEVDMIDNNKTWSKNKHNEGENSALRNILLERNAEEVCDRNNHNEISDFNR